jgi:alginate O-acetyltransferase complex protein AlgI
MVDRVVDADSWPGPGSARAWIASGGTMPVVQTELPVLGQRPKEPPVRRLIPHRRFRPISAPISIGRPGLYPGEPEHCRRRLREFLGVLLQLGLLLAVFYVYRIETASFRLLATVALAALPAHYLAPFRWKKPLFVAASVVGMTLVVGPATTAGVLAVSAVLIALAAAPLGISWRARVALIVAVAGTVAVLRPNPAYGADVSTAGIIPLIASMFMFRMVIYLYERKHAKAVEPLADTLAYFFLLPNDAFLHFPVVDFRTFQRGYFARDIHEIQRTGLAMILRGTLHLLAYRIVHGKLLIPADQVHDVASLAAYLACNYLLYLRVSGQFHVACGLLHLFGFQLPETHHHYLLATSFTDYWRRINIYWKDFMVRIVFNPVVFRLKRWPQPAALATATTAVFLVTWFLHAYQSYWLRGVWGFSVPDALFWGILGLLVLINVQLDARRSRRPIGDGSWSPLRLALQAVRVAGTFTTIALLWSLWSSPSVGAWLGLLRRGLGI